MYLFKISPTGLRNSTLGFHGARHWISVKLGLENDWGKGRPSSPSCLLCHAVSEHRKSSSHCKYNSWAFETRRIPAYSVCVESEVPSLWEDGGRGGLGHACICVGLEGPSSFFFTTTWLLFYWLTALIIDIFLLSLKSALRMFFSQSFYWRNAIQFLQETTK